jgi:hypothetical protein
MMHQITRKLSKMPEDVKGEISPYFLERYAIPEETPPVTATKLDDSAEYITSGLTVHQIPAFAILNPVPAVSRTIRLAYTDSNALDSTRTCDLQMVSNFSEEALNSPCLLIAASSH